MQAVETLTHRDYGIGNPLDMIMPDTSRVGEEGNKVLQRGMRSDYTPLSPFKEATLQEAKENSFMFLQISGVKGGSLTGNTAEVSIGLPWDRQSPMENCAEAIARNIAGEGHQLMWFGPHKFLVLIEEDLAPEQMLRRLVIGPREPYERELPHLSKAVNQMQNIRAFELLYSEENRIDFTDIFNGNKDPLVRPYQNNQRWSFVWGCENRNSELWGVNLENQPQRIAELAIDEETEQLLLEKQDFLTQVKKTSRYVVQLDFSATVSCCNIAFNAQQATSESVFNPDQIIFEPTFKINAEGPYTRTDLAVHPSVIYESEQYCQKCKKNKTENKCGCFEIK